MSGTNGSSSLGGENGTQFLSDSSANRRVAPRVIAKHGVWCESPNLTLYTQTVNLSSTGAFVRVPQPLDPGARVQLRFADVDITFQTEVVWTRKRQGSASDHPGMGVRFLDREAHTAYEALLARLAESGESPTGPRKPTK